MKQPPYGDSPAPPTAQGTDPDALAAADRARLIHPHLPGGVTERVVMVEGSGCRLRDAHGREYLDATGGLMLAHVGHGRRELVEAAAGQMARLEYYTSFHEFTNEPSIRLAERLVDLAPAPMERVYFTSGGAEAVDAALRMARLYHHRRGEPDRTWVLARHFGYHGVTYGGAAVTGMPMFHQGFGPMMPGVRHLTPPMPSHPGMYGGEDPTEYCLRELRETIEEIGADRIAAMIGEPILGVAGVVEPPRDYWPRVRELLDAHGILLVLDEVITGFGRTGHWFAAERLGVAPDLIVTAKGLTSGYFPMGALLAAGHVADVVTREEGFLGGYTYSGHATGCAVALENLRILEREGLLAAATEIGGRLGTRLRALEELPVVAEVRQIGLMLGIELTADPATGEAAPADRVPPLVRERHGVIVRNNPNTVLLSPPLVMSRWEADRVADAVTDVLTEYADRRTHGRTTPRTTAAAPAPTAAPASPASAPASASASAPAPTPAPTPAPASAPAPAPASPASPPALAAPPAAPAPTAHPLLDKPWNRPPSMPDLLAAAMEWHFNPQTGSRFWLERARTLDFDPRRDVRTEADLALFPNVVDELRDVRVEDLVPRGYGDAPVPPDVYESGGTTGPPKRVAWLPDLHERLTAWHCEALDARGVPRGVNWLTIGPSGPHVFAPISRTMAHRRGGIPFTVDLDPRWVKKCVAEGRAEDAKRYAEHVLDQVRAILRSQDVGVVFTTPPLLEAMAGDDELAGLLDRKVSTLIWGGASMSVDTRTLLREEVFPGARLIGFYGSTMVGGGMYERAGSGPHEPSTFDPPYPFISLRVVDPATGATVPYGERGQVVMSHVSRSMLLPNNLERDTALRVRPAGDGAGDAVADIRPVPTFGGTTVIEGVY
ncbi:aminotransferase class III-fold pyridoxal phosphate-dependent enzyme [Streptomyces fradiae]|uniref:aminotransferase class III-fold pyridoxal phosphate-dependent enzyme n=1 Tax=Streptomyces fradiae TaxID=1906 RepID=UPI002942817C|nr:aminotransferase class III-fold pyridoxal phosphate-dependent enzyme [Streptomyces fradiae]WOI58937.1 aminotransferase class III-fold pyridoxal phosphate-dependent enzyme [Streptomyces fradiae]